MSFLNDADLDMLALVEAGNLLAKGICCICEEPLDALDPRWDDLEIRVQRGRDLVTIRIGDDTVERSRYAQILGPSTRLDGFHDACLDGDDDLDPPPINPDSIGRYADCDAPPSWFDPSICGESWDGE